MKSVSFLRNTWKKWESKASDRSNTEDPSPHGIQKPSFPRASTTNSRGLSITVKHIPLEISKSIPVDGSWRASEDYQPPPSPIYDQFTQHRGDLSLISRESSRSALDVAYYREEERGPISPRGSTPTSPKTLRHTSGPAPHSNYPAQPTVIYDNEHNLSSPRHPSSPRQTTTSLRSPTLPTYQLLPPIDLNYGPGSKFERTLEGSGCKCVRASPQSRHREWCPRHSLDGSVPHRTALDGRRSAQKTVHAVLDLSLDAHPRSLYHHTGSTPHLPYKARSSSRPTPSEDSGFSEGSDADHFPLSLFPVPPPLIVRKKVPAPLVLRPMHPASSSPSSRDSTPVGTPTTPRFHAASPAGSASPGKKHFSLRPAASFSPPPFSPPNSPLPRVPTTPDGARRSPDYGGRPLRGAQSSANLREALPFAARQHRLTSSEPMSEQIGLPSKRPVAMRGVCDLEAYMVRFYCH